MGKLTLLLVAAAVLGGTLLTANLRTSLYGTSRVRAEDQADTVAREIALSAQSIALSKMVGGGGFQDPGFRTPTALDGGEFDVELAPGWTPEMATVVVRGRYGGAVHEIQSTYRYDPVDAPGPLWLDVPYATAFSARAQISGGRPVYFDARKHEALGLASFLPLAGIESLTSLNSLAHAVQGAGSALQVPTAQEWTGDDGLLGDLNVDDTEGLYQAAEAAFDAQRDVRLGGDQFVSTSVQWGAAEAITIVEGGLTITGRVRGQGALIVKGPLRVPSSGRLDWDGLVLVRSTEDVLPIELDGDVEINGALAVAHDALPPGGHLDVSVYRNASGITSAAPWGDVSRRVSPWNTGSYPFHQHTHAFDRTPETAPRGAHVYYMEGGTAGRHAVETQFYDFVRSLGNEQVYLEFGNSKNHGFSRVTVDVAGRGILHASPRTGFPAGFASAGDVSRSEPFRASDLRGLDVDVRSLRALRQAFDSDVCGISKQWPLCVGMNYNRREALGVRVMRARDDARLYESTLYWHMRTDEEAAHAAEEAAWLARIQAGEAFGTRLRLGDKVKITYARAPISALTPTLGFDGNQVVLVATASRHVTETEPPSTGKVLICHEPDSKRETKRVDAKKLQTHLSHGDTRGACPTGP